MTEKQYITFMLNGNTWDTLGLYYFIHNSPDKSVFHMRVLDRLRRRKVVRREILRRTL